MANHADVYIKNMLTEGVKVIHKLPDGSYDLELSIAFGEEERSYLEGTDMSLVINAPRGMDIKYGSLRARTDIDMTVSFSRTDSSWEINIKPNNLEPESPTTVYIALGVDGP